MSVVRFAVDTFTSHFLIVQAHKYSSGTAFSSIGKNNSGETESQSQLTNLSVASLDN